MLALAGCSDDGGGADSETGDEQTETGDGDGDGDGQDGHGTIRIEPSAFDDDVSVFDGTAEVVATVVYQSCLQDFYLVGNPTMQQTGPDGAAIFADAVDELCSLAGSPACSVVAIEQTLLEANNVFTLRVTYAIDDPATLANSNLYVGPLPTSELAGCQATVEVQQSGLLGRDSGGTQIWRIATLPGSNSAQVDQATPLLVGVIEQ